MYRLGVKKIIVRQIELAEVLKNYVKRIVYEHNFEANLDDYENQWNKNFQEIEENRNAISKYINMLCGTPLKLN